MRKFLKLDNFIWKDKMKDIIKIIIKGPKRFNDKRKPQTQKQKF